MLTPLVAGALELLPWIQQWHSGIDPTLDVDIAEYLDAQIDTWTDALGVPRPDLPAWRPPTQVRGRRTAAARSR